MDWNSHKPFIIGLSKAFSDLHFKVEDILAEGDKVALSSNCYWDSQRGVSRHTAYQQESLFHFHRHFK